MITTGNQDAAQPVSTKERVTTTASGAVGAESVEAVVGQVSEGSTAADIPAARFMQTDTPRTTTTTPTAQKEEGAAEYREDVEAGECRPLLFSSAQM
jgi:hypothetical protein